MVLLISTTFAFAARLEPAIPKAKVSRSHCHIHLRGLQQDELSPSILRVSWTLALLTVYLEPFNFFPSFFFYCFDELMEKLFTLFSLNNHFRLIGCWGSGSRARKLRRSWWRGMLDEEDPQCSYRLSLLFARLIDQSSNIGCFIYIYIYLEMLKTMWQSISQMQFG